MRITKSNQEKNEKKNFKEVLQRVKKQVQGITLIALVVTIIVLVILAGIALNLTIGQNGIFSRAQNAADTWQMAEQNEQKEIEQAGDFLEIYSQGVNTASKVPEAITQNKFYLENTKIKDDLDNEVVIPAYFKLASDSAVLVEDGIVIEDKDGNQFVWIPARTGAGATINLSAGGTTTIVYQRTAFTGEDITTDFTETMPSDEEASVDAWGGYYIGRFEAGDKESTEEQTMRASGASQTNTITIKKDQAPYNNITFANLKSLAEGMDTAQGYSTATTKLVSSYAWDTAISFIQIKNSDYGTNSPEGNYRNTTFTYTDITGASQTKNNNSSTLVPTGQTTAVSNIYDMGGNLYEYTAESYSGESNHYVGRGGHSNVYYDGTPAGSRSGRRWH